MTKGIITVLDENRIVDRIAKAAYKYGLYDYDHARAIIRESDEEVVGWFRYITGPRLIVRFLEFITEVRGNNVKKVEID